MAILQFDARNHPVAPPIRLTFGRSRTEFRWTDRRDVTFDELCEVLRTSPIGSKDGPCYTPACFAGGARRMDQAAHIDVAVLDADCGHSFEEISAAVRARGWRAIIHSTYSHLSTQTMIAAAPAEKWMEENPGATIAGYMRAKKGYLPRVVADAVVVDDLRDGNSRNLVVQHQPCPKFRIILPLQDPWVAGNFATQGVANAKWRERIGALAHALGLHHDQSCVDTSRLFYLPRRRDDGQEYIFDVTAGDECPLWELPDAEPDEPEPATLFNAPAAEIIQMPRPAHKNAVAGDGRSIDLTSWAARYALRFEVVEALRSRGHAAFSSRRSGVKHHLVCPNAGEHISGGAEGTGTYAVNASQVEYAQLPSIRSGFVIHCMHNGCAGKDRLDHLATFLKSGALTVEDLTDARFLMPEPPPVDASAIIQSTAKASATPAASPDAQGNIPPALYTNLPGAFGRMHDWIVATSPKPQPALALGAVLAFTAAVVGQRVQLQHFNTRPNIYVLAIGHSGAGKDRPPSACKQMARAAGMFTDIIGVEEVASDAGIITAVHKTPAQVMLLDEISFLLNAANNSRSGPHIANVIGVMLKLYSSSSGTFQGKAYADPERIKGGPKVIDQPCASVYGSTTPAGITGALTSKDVTSGLLSRMVIFDAGDCDPRINPPANEPVPPEIIDWIIAFRKIPIIQNVMHRVGGEAVMEPRVVMMTQDAFAMAMAFEGEMHTAKAKARPRGKDALYVRALENALKFALLRACSTLAVMSDTGPVIDESQLCVDAATMRWAIDLSRATVERMDATTDEIADTPFEEQLKALRDLIKKGGARGVTMREIAKQAAGRRPKKVMDDLFEALTTAGDAFFVTGIKTKTRTRDAWVHRDFIKHHNPNLETDDADAE